MNSLSRPLFAIIAFAWKINMMVMIDRYVRFTAKTNGYKGEPCETLHVKYEIYEELLHT